MTNQNLSRKEKLEELMKTYHLEDDYGLVAHFEHLSDVKLARVYDFFCDPEIKKIGRKYLANCKKEYRKDWVAIDDELKKEWNYDRKMYIHIRMAHDALPQLGVITSRMCRKMSEDREMVYGRSRKLLNALAEGGAEEFNRVGRQLFRKYGC